MVKQVSSNRNYKWFLWIALVTLILGFFYGEFSLTVDGAQVLAINWTHISILFLIIFLFKRNRN